MEKREHKGSRVKCLLWRNEAATLGFMFPCMQLFNTLPVHFLHDRKQCPVFAATNQHVCHCARENVCLQNSVGVWAELGVCFEKSRGKFPCLSACHCSVSLKVHACGWKTKPAELCLSVLVEKHPPTDRATVYLQGGSHAGKMLTYREHINSSAGRQTQLHFARCLLCV